MENQVKIICCMKDTYLWKLLLAILILLYSAKFSAFFPSKWFRQGKDLKEWKGNMFSVYSSGGLIEKETYLKLRDYYCAEYTNFPYTYSSTELNYYDGNALCIKFSGLNSGIPALIVFSIFSFLIGISLMIAFKCSKTKRGKLCLMFALNLLQLLCEFACSICIGASADLTLFDDCHYFYIYTDTATTTAKACGDLGPIFSLFASLSIIIVNIVTIVCIVIYYCTTEVVSDAIPEVEIINQPIENQQPIPNLPEIPIQIIPVEPNHPEILIMKKERSIDNVD